MRSLQIVLPFFIAGLGTCLTGIILDRVQYWKSYANVDELFLLLPALLGLKGNLQMTLASRLSTHSHLGHLQTREDLLSLTCANLSLNQCFSIVVCLIASTLVMVIKMFTTSSPFEGDHALLIVSTALLTSSVTSFLLDILMVLVIQVSTQYNINPDNVATPIAATLGDITALMLSSSLADLFFDTIVTKDINWLAPFIVIFYIALLPIWVRVTQDNVHTTNILKQASHWYPIITAMLISSISGVILRTSVSKSEDIALFTPVLCGVGGNVVAVQASRLSTLLHRQEQRGSLPQGHSICMNPCNLLTSDSPGFSITRFLMSMVIPGQILFYSFSIYTNPQINKPSLSFMLLYLTGSQFQVTILIYLAYVLTYLLWVHGVDPDNCTIPYLTSISDVLGACLVTFICLVSPPNLHHKVNDTVILNMTRNFYVGDPKLI